jgi:hypothetical protein
VFFRALITDNVLLQLDGTHGTIEPGLSEPPVASLNRCHKADIQKESENVIE